LVGVKDVLPDVKQSVSVSEGKHNEGRVDAEDALDVLLVLLDVVGVDWSIGGITDVAFPVDQVRLVFFAYDHGIGETHLLNVGQGGCNCQ